MEKLIVYHGSSHVVTNLEIRIAKFNKDFYFGFYSARALETLKFKEGVLIYGEK